MLIYFEGNMLHVVYLQGIIYVWLLFSSGLHLGRLYVDPFERANKCCTWDALLGRSKLLFTSYSTEHY